MQYSNQKPKIAESLVILLDEIKDLKDKNNLLKNDLNQLKNELNQFKDYLNKFPKNEHIDYQKISNGNTQNLNKLLELLRNHINQSGINISSTINSRITDSENKIIEAVNNKKMKFL